MAYFVTVNAPGYAPDCEPIACDDFQDAREVLFAEIVHTADALDSNGFHIGNKELDAFKADIAAAEPGSHTWQVLGLAHCIVEA